MRGIAALWVVLMHASYDWNNVFRTGERYTNLIMGAGLWVHFFFLLSGVVIANAYARTFALSISARSFGRFLWIRFGRIYPLYGLLLVIWAVLTGVGMIEARAPEGSMIASVLLIQGFIFGDDVWNYPGWSISAEWLAYCSFPFIIWSLALLDDRRRAAVVIVVAVGIEALWGLSPGTSEVPALSAAFCLLEFSLGCLIAQFTSSMQVPKFGNVVKNVICLMPIVLLALPASSYSGWILGFATLSCALAIAIIATQDTTLGPFLRSRPMQFPGIISYSIYLWHALLFRVARAIVDFGVGETRVIARLPPLAALGTFLLYVAILVGVSWMSYVLIEEPSRRWFKRSAVLADPLATR